MLLFWIMSVMSLDPSSANKVVNDVNMRYLEDGNIHVLFHFIGSFEKTCGPSHLVLFLHECSKHLGLQCLNCKNYGKLSVHVAGTQSQINSGAELILREGNGNLCLPSFACLKWTEDENVGENIIEKIPLKTTAPVNTMRPYERQPGGWLERNEVLIIVLSISIFFVCCICCVLFCNARSSEAGEPIVTTLLTSIISEVGNPNTSFLGNAVSSLLSPATWLSSMISSEVSSEWESESSMDALSEFEHESNHSNDPKEKRAILDVDNYRHDLMGNFDSKDGFQKENAREVSEIYDKFHDTRGELRDMKRYLKDLESEFSEGSIYGDYKKTQQSLVDRIKQNRDGKADAELKFSKSMYRDKDMISQNENEEKSVSRDRILMDWSEDKSVSFDNNYKNNQF